MPTSSTPPRNSRQRQIQREVLDIYVEPCCGALARRGPVGLRHPQIAAFNILGLLNWMLRWYRPGGQAQRGRDPREIISFALRGIGLPE